MVGIDNLQIRVMHQLRVCALSVPSWGLSRDSRFHENVSRSRGNDCEARRDDVDYVKGIYLEELAWF